MTVNSLMLLVLLELLLKEGKITEDIVDIAYDKIADLIIEKFDIEK